MMDLKCYRCGAWPCSCPDGQCIVWGDSAYVLQDGIVASVLVTDPPYGIDSGKGTIGKRGRAAKVTWRDSGGDVRGVYAVIVRMALEITGGRGVVTPGAPHAFEYPKPKDIGMIYQPCATGCSSWGRATCQPVLFYGADPRAGKHLDPITFTHNQAAEKCGHPTPKPLAVMKWLVVRACIGDDVVLDPFLGSGTTLVAAKALGFRGIGIEICERYAECAANRLRQGVLDFGAA